MRPVALLVVFALASCGDAAAPDEIGDQTSVMTSNSTVSAGAALDGPVMRYLKPSKDDDEMAAIVAGTLQLESKCLYISRAEIAERYPVLWPAGTHWDEQSRSVFPPAAVESLPRRSLADRWSPEWALCL